MDYTHKRAAWTVLILVLFIIFVSVFLSHVGPKEVVSQIGIGQSYVAIFIVALLGGTSTFTSATYLTTLVTFAVGGLNPIFLGLLAGTGLFISDSFFFYMGTKSRTLATGKLREYADKFENWLREKPRWVVPIATFVYAGLTPLPNDVLTLSLAFAEIEFKRIAIPLWVGSIVLTTIIALLASQGLGFFMTLRS